MGKVVLNYILISIFWISFCIGYFLPRGGEKGFYIFVAACSGMWLFIYLVKWIGNTWEDEL